MALNWTLTDIKNMEETCYVKSTDCGGSKMSPVTETLLWSTMFVGMNRITEKNFEEFFCRISAYEKLLGALRTGFDENGAYISQSVTLAEVRSHIGLGTNASTMTSAQYTKHLFGTYSRLAVSNAKRDEKAEVEVTQV